MQKRTKPARYALTMPAGKMLCTKAGIASGLFNYHTRHYFIEANPLVQRQLILEHESIGMEWYAKLWPDYAHNLDIATEFGDINFDFVYLDFCTQIRGYEARWLHRVLTKHLAENATLAITMNRCWRREPFMKWWCHDVVTCDAEVKTLLRKAEQMIYKSDCVGKVGDVTSYLDDSRVTYESDYIVPGRPKEGWNKTLIPTYQQITVNHVALMLLLFSQFDFQLSACIEYRRVPRRPSASMLTLVMKNMQHRKRPRCSKALLQELYSHFRPISSFDI